MRNLVCQLIMISVLFLSLDSAADRVAEGHPHGGADSVDAALTVCQAAAGDEEHTDLNSDHCEHCCHGHAASIAIELRSTTNAPLPTDARRRLPELHALDGRAPPTPPPNA